MADGTEIDHLASQGAGVKFIGLYGYRFLDGKIYKLPCTVDVDDKKIKGEFYYEEENANFWNWKYREKDI